MITVALKSNPRRSSQKTDKGEYSIVNWRINTHPHAWRPPTDVYEKEDCYVVRVEIAGMRESDFIISLDQNVLTIRGVRPDIAERHAYHQMEINFGEFFTTFELQAPVDAERIKAEYQNGFLWVVLPKAQSRINTIKDNE